MKMHIVTCVAPVNIAVIKYWGKRDENLILPLNSSISVTLSPTQLRAKTTVALSKDFEKTRIWLNAVEQNPDNPRLQNIIRKIKHRAFRCNGEKNGKTNKEDMLNWHLHICSENNFPVSAGLASSAAGYSCLVTAMANLFEVEGDLSGIARLGSGSACRSMYGGFVEWDLGHCSDGSDSLARQIAPYDHWPELRALLLVVSEQPKTVSSTVGMQNSVNTSELLRSRVECIVPRRLAELRASIAEKDFEKFAQICMKESNQFHAICLDTYPPIGYLTEVSDQIIALVHRFNKLCERLKVAYTFDAGPNACLFLMEEDVPRFLSLIRHFFRPVNNGFENFIHGLPVDVPRVTTEDVLNISIGVMPDSIHYVIYTSVCFVLFCS
ncbi:diphosphomevalonate decarboxylase isoform X1 [Octopus bimaculoides]|uniref:Diphosphomevalonate decarboxylase n=1 Tax=Octopus bimaculoides TaxID=37653 RepID=A0A0L8HG26_OCTBM|nr:diphosphomevalonate decarboxylase isoform X1 [Octopus bimaculoides]|eukprot:XP_014772589.1 PREDICTED: diphosphomevalonate decarboxylase-like isoform X1 [Octopus bimaculoides]